MERALLGWLSWLCLMLLASDAYAAEIEVENARLRLLPGDVPAGGYFVLRNVGDRPVTLVDAQSPSYGRIMMHETVRKDGMTRMIGMPSLVVAPGGQLEFAPGGYHLMFTQRRRPLAVGDEIEVSLLFENGERFPVIFEAVSPMSP